MKLIIRPIKNIPVIIPSKEIIKKIIVGEVEEETGKKKKFIKLHCAAKFWKERISMIIPRTIVPERKNILRLRIDQTLRLTKFILCNYIISQEIDQITDQYE